MYFGQSAPFIAVAALIAPAGAQTLVENINAVESGGFLEVVDSDPKLLLVVGDRLYFSADTTATGRELWWLDVGGGEPQLVANIAFGAGDGDPLELTALPDGRVVFTAQTSATGREVWVTDGSEAGTQMLVELTVGWSTSEPTGLTAHQDAVYFFASDEQNPERGIYRTDGTPAGTERIEDFPAGGPSLDFYERLVSAGSRLYYSVAQVAPSQWRLFATDGSPGGAQQVANVAVSGSGWPTQLTAAGENVVWIAPLFNNGVELFVNSGVPASTQAVDLLPGAASSEPAFLTRVGDEVYFRAVDPVDGREIFRTDGTVAGTVRVTDLLAGGGAQPVPTDLAEAHGQLFFTLDDLSGATGSELWTTDGTFGGEILYADLVPGPESSHPTLVTELGAGVLCLAESAATGSELYFSGGSVGTTGLVADLAPGPDSIAPAELVSMGSTVYFPLDTPQFGIEPWVTDGTEIGTALVANLASGTFNLSSSPKKLTGLGDVLVFSADDGWVGEELWASDGSEAGTVLLADIRPGPAGSHLGSFARVGGRVLFSADDGVRGSELWVTDGTAQGTGLLIELAPGPAGSLFQPFEVWRGELYFLASGPNGESALYATDGTQGGTRLVFAAPDDGYLFVQNLVVHRDRLFFAANVEAFGHELWTSDGTTAGTHLVIDLNPGPEAGVYTVDAASLGEHLYFAGQVALGQAQLYRTDGTAAGTELFAVLDPDSGSAPARFVTVGDRLVFDARVGNQRQYWGTDGVTVQQLTFPPLAHDADHLLVSNGTFALGRMVGPPNSKELIRTDGTAAGTSIVLQLSPNAAPFDEFKAWHPTSGPKTVFRSATFAVGNELFVTDGTAAGTFHLTDLEAGPASSTPGDDLVRVGEHLYFSLWSLEDGHELYSLPVADLADWVAKAYGSGCAGSSGAPPSIAASGSATLGGALTIEVSDAAPGAAVGNFFALDYAFTPLGGCDVYLGALIPLPPSSTDGAGTASLALAVPADPSAAGFALWIQSLVVDPGGSFLGFAALTPALEVIVGS